MITAAILSFLSGIWSRFSFAITIAGAVVVALGVAFLRGRSAGKAAYVEKREAAKEAASKKAEKIRNETDHAPDAGVDKRLDKWMRD